MTVDSLVGFMRKTRPLDSHRHFVTFAYRENYRLRHIFTTFIPENSEKRQRKIRWWMNQLSPKWITVRMDLP
ncbi:hypothetical protein EAT47_07795 [Salmonella enterica]|uniref:Uncharacterized protein n=1 Tax=Salmonella enterica subsp. enterica serovar Gaminara TaxID=913070 RepID=A0A7Z1QV26_SALET|nr:hypothetical protein [Salmonella enterica]PVM69027.1 hypothetical protein C4784_00720 [Salmonella enterica subsp. enterica serovar Gaminara]